MSLLAKQHLLPSVRWLIESIVQTDIFSRIDLVSKHYSNIDWVSRRLPQSVRLLKSEEDFFLNRRRDDIVLLDEGGGLHSALPKDYTGRSAGVEQTTFGLRTVWKCPMVLTCRSAAKLFFETQIIARGVLRKLDDMGLSSGATFGVIGLGALGSEIARALLNRGAPTIGTEVGSVPFDLTDIAVGVSELLRRSDIILGCTGSDVLAGVDLDALGGQKLFASCSSNDIEFRSVLKQLPVHPQFESAHGMIGSTYCTVLNGGFPVNFDRETEWELFDEIILTRRLVLAGIMQANSLIGTAPRGVMLEPATQMRIVNEWLQQVPNRAEIRTPNALTEAFFRAFSEGEYMMGKKPGYALHSTTPSAVARMRSHKEPYDVDILGLSIIVSPNVWSPAYDWSSSFYVENLPDVKGRDFLEIGCGTGVISVFAAKAGAARVVAIDVNEEAVKNTRLNFERFGIRSADVFVSDGFANVHGKFDVVTWNAPYHGSKPADLLERGCADEDYRDIRTFFRLVSTHLKPGGTVVFCFSESGDLPLIETLITESGFRIKRKLSDWRHNYNCMLLDLVRAERKST